MKIDEVGYWSELKLEIIKKYAGAYSQILAAQKSSLEHHYIDAFAGAGIHVAKRTGELQIVNVTGVDDVEAAVAVHDRLARSGGAAAEVQQLLQRADFAIGRARYSG